jgi:hypothetical protein
MPTNRFLRSWILPGGFFLISLAIFVCFQSAYLDDSEALLTARVLEADIPASVELAQSNPGYRFAAQTLSLLTGDAETALIWLSHIAGAIGVALIALLGRLWFSARIGALAATIILIAPLYFRHSIIANSALPALVCALGSIALLSNRTQSRLPMLGSGLLLGWSIGIHLPYTLFWILAVGVYSFTRQNRKAIPNLVIGAFGGVATWFIPAILSSDYSPSTRQLILTLNPSSRLNELFSNWFVPLLLLLLLSVLSGCLLYRNRVRSLDPKKPAPQKTILALCLLGLAIVAFIISPLITTIAFALVSSSSIGLYLERGPMDYLKKRSILILAIAIIVGLYNQVHLGFGIRNSTPAYIQATEFIQSQFDSDNTAIYTSSPTHWIPYGLSDYKTGFLPEGNSLTPRSFNPSFRFILSDQTLPDFVQSESHTFSSTRIYPEKSSLDIHVYDTNLSTVYWESGTFDREDWGEWISESASGFVRADSIGDTRLHLTVRSSPPNPKRLEILIDDQVAWSQEIPTQDTNYIIDLPLDRNGSNIEFRSLDACQRPSDLGNSSDDRCLAFAISNAVIGKPLYRLNERIRLDREAEKRPDLSRGWSTPNEELTWTDSQKAAIQLQFERTLTGALELQILGHFNLYESIHTQLNLEFWVNDTLVDARTVSFENRIDPKFIIPESAHNGSRTLEIEFRFAGLKSPQEMGASDDSRQLGLAIRSLSISQSQ